MKRHFLSLRLGFLVLLISAAGSNAAILTAASCSFADVKAAYDSSADGDTLIVPVGSATWSSMLTISKGIALIGQTTTDTVNGSAIDNTVIQDNAPRPSGNIIKIISLPGKSYRVSGLTFSPLATVGGSGAAITITGNSHSVRVDHCHFQNLSQIGHMVQVGGPIYGVADHNFLEFSSGNAQGFNIAMPDWNAPGNNFGDGSWADFPWYGTEKFWFMEDNYFVNNRVGASFLPVTDDYLGARWVFRHNKSFNMWLQSHGTEGARQRGHRACEVYNNEWHFSQSLNAGGMRTGGILTHDNSWYGSRPADGFSLQTYRSYFTWPTGVWIGGSGDCAWDLNDTSGTSTSAFDGTNTPGQTPFLYWSGTAASGTNLTTIVDGGNLGWTPNQWVNFVARRLADNGIGLITANTANTLTVLHYSLGGGVPWTAGDQYQIHKPISLMDQNGRGKGDLITGTGSGTINSATGRPGWPHQLVEPCYSWNDYFVSSAGAKLAVNLHGSFSPTVRSGRDYFNLGVGATDAAVRTTYVAALNGTDYLGPYVYPHPLVSGATPSPTPTPTPTPTPAPTPSPTPEPTATPTPTPPSPTPSPTSEPTATPEPTPSPSPSPSQTPEPTPSPTPDPSPSPTPSPSPSPSPSITPITPTPSATPTASPTASPSPSNGIASRYPNDKNIASDPDVIFADDFESYTTPDQAKTKWGNGSGTQRMRIATEPGTVFSGSKSIEFSLPVSTTEVSSSLWKILNPTQDTVFMRMYQKFDAGYNVPTSNHNGIRLSAKYPETAGHIPPADGTGFFLFLLQNNALKASEPTPGYNQLYVYWPKQRSQWGDEWYSDGTVLPYNSATGNKGLWLAYPSQYPDFKPMPNFLPQRDRWYCVELMVRANTPGKNDGEVKIWTDGKVTGDFPDLNVRSISTLKLDHAHLTLHALHSERINKKWYDNVVIAKSYIGPMASAPPSPTATPTPDPTPSPTPDPSPSPTATPEPTPSPSVSPTPSPSPSITPLSNTPPKSHAGADKTIRMPNSVMLYGSASDDGRPNPPAKCTFRWSKVSGPGTITWGAQNSLTTKVRFSSRGIYVLKLTVSDGQLSGTDTVTVTVKPRL